MRPFDQRAATGVAACGVFVTSFLFRFLQPAVNNDFFVHVVRGRQMLLGELPVRDFDEPGLARDVCRVGTRRGVWRTQPDTGGHGQHRLHVARCCPRVSARHRGVPVPDHRSADRRVDGVDGASALLVSEDLPLPAGPVGDVAVSRSARPAPGPSSWPYAPRWRFSSGTITACTSARPSC